MLVPPVRDDTQAARLLLDCMTLAQVIVLVEHIQAVQKAGFGTVTLEVRKGHVRFVIPAPHVELPGPEE